MKKVFDKMARDVSRPVQRAGQLSIAPLTLENQRAIFSEFCEYPVIKHVMKFRQFMARGLKHVGDESSLVALAWTLKRMTNINMA